MNKDTNLKSIFNIVRWVGITLSFWLAMFVTNNCYANAEPQSLNDIYSHYLRHFTNWADLQYSLNIIIALAMAFPLGIANKHKTSSTKISTYAGILLSTALLSSIILHIYFTYNDKTIFTAMGGVITGIGFIAGAVIFKNESRIKGLASSASLWATAGIGLAIGLEFYMTGILVTALLSIFAIASREN